MENPLSDPIVRHVDSLSPGRPLHDPKNCPVCSLSPGERAGVRGFLLPRYSLPIGLLRKCAGSVKVAQIAGIPFTPYPDTKVSRGKERESTPTLLQREGETQVRHFAD